MRVDGLRPIPYTATQVDRHLRSRWADVGTLAAKAPRIPNRLANRHAPFGHFSRLVAFDAFGASPQCLVVLPAVRVGGDLHVLRRPGGAFEALLLAAHRLGFG